ncbi:MAG TPA: T9SS type A sorting domain-containing protein [Bacteroidales bacterium]|nr:T9SS type A sorting domain-containing protein [Bacteroidales bacterium]
MKYHILFFLVAFSTSINAQNLQWISTGAGDAYYSENNAIAVASTDNYIYISGHAVGDKVYIKDTTISHGDFSFIAQFDKEGNLRWIRENSGEEANDIAVNSKYEVYTFYKPSLLNHHIIKYDMNGNQLWDKELPYDIDFFKSITVDKNDNLLITGRYFTIGNSLTFEDTVIYNVEKDKTNSFVMKYDSEGRFKWFTSSKISPFGASLEFSDLQTNDDGEAYVTGYYEIFSENDSIQFGDFHLNSRSNPAYPENYFSGTDIVLAKLSANGEVLWAKGYGGQRDDRGNKIAVNASGDVFMTGVYNDTVCFSNFKSAFLGFHGFLCKVNPEGVVEWANQIASNTFSNTNEQSKAVAADDNYIYVGGYYPGSWAVFGSTNLEDSMIVFNDFKHGSFLARYSPQGDFISVNHIIGDVSGIEDINLNGRSVYVAGNALPPATIFSLPFPIVSNNHNMHFFLTSLQYDPLTGYPENNAGNISFYPNPVSGFFIIQGESKEEITSVAIIDLKGNFLIFEKISGNYSQIDVSSLPAGMYILKIQTTNGFEIRKLVKSNP